MNDISFHLAGEFLVDALKKNPKAAYADIKAKAEEKNLKLFPVMFGLAPPDVARGRPSPRLAGPPPPVRAFTL